MPHGAPDWSDIVKQQQVHRLDDMAELAARLGAIHRWDRRGDVLFFDDFSNGLNHWWTVSEPPSEFPKIITETSEYGGYSVKFQPTDGDSKWQEMWKLLAYPQPTILGFEFSFTTHFYLLYLVTRLNIVYPTVEYGFAFRYNHKDLKMEYCDQNLVWQTIWSDYELRYDKRLFHHMKFVIDSDRNEYIRLIVDHQTADLAGIPGYLVGETGGNYLFWTITVYAQTGQTATIYVDNCIITMNEPVG